MMTQIVFAEFIYCQQIYSVRGTFPGLRILLKTFTQVMNTQILSIMQVFTS